MAATIKKYEFLDSQRGVSLYYESGWYVNWYVDACHAGTCIEKTAKWLSEESDKKENCINDFQGDDN